MVDENQWVNAAAKGMAEERSSPLEEAFSERSKKIARLYNFYTNRPQNVQMYFHNHEEILPDTRADRLVATEILRQSEFAFLTWLQHTLSNQEQPFYVSSHLKEQRFAFKNMEFQALFWHQVMTSLFLLASALPPILGGGGEHEKQKEELANNLHASPAQEHAAPVPSGAPAHPAPCLSTVPV
eukprot:GSA25T00009349001.1